MENDITKDNKELFWDEGTMKRLDNLADEMQKTSNVTSKVDDQGGVPWLFARDRNETSGNNSWAMLYATMEQRVRALCDSENMRGSNVEPMHSGSQQSKATKCTMTDNTIESASINGADKEQT